MSEHLTDPLRWAEAFNTIEHGYKMAAIGLLAGFIYAVIQKWRPRK